MIALPLFAQTTACPAAEPLPRAFLFLSLRRPQVRFGVGRRPGIAATAGKRVLRAGRRSEISCGGLTRNQRRSAGLGQIDAPEDLACALYLPRSGSARPPPWT